MGLFKLISNRISKEWKETFNKNVDYLNNLEKKLSDQNKTTNSRIDNLVLHSGGESPNEVVDARVNREGETFETLQGRLVATETKQEDEIAALAEQQTATAEQVEQLNASVATIIGGSGANLDLYVSAENGSDQTGDGSEDHPFATIQVAVNQIPLISIGYVTVWIDDGVYLEDVYIRNINANQIDVRAKNNVDEGAYVKGDDMPVKVRSINFSHCSGYFRVYGLQAVDQANTSRAFCIEHGGYLSVVCVKCAEDTKHNTSHRAVRALGNSKCHVYNCYFENQNIAIEAVLMSEINVSYNNNGKNNTIGLRVDNATLRDGLPTSLAFATIRRQASAIGLIISKGTVL